MCSRRDRVRGGEALADLNQKKSGTIEKMKKRAGETVCEAKIEEKTKNKNQKTNFERMKNIEEEKLKNVEKKN